MEIKIQGARENNLKNIDITFSDGLTVVTGVSGSGKSSLVFDTLYHESRRNFLDLFTRGRSSVRLPPAKVNSINGLTPAIAVGQNLLNRNPNSNLATASGIHPLLRLLYARFGNRTCPNCGAKISINTEDEIVSRIRSLAEKNPVTIFSHIVQNSYGSHQTLLTLLSEQFDNQKIIVDEKKWDRNKLNPNQLHNISIEIAQINDKTTLEQIRSYVKKNQMLGANVIQILFNKKKIKLSRAKACVECGTWLLDVETKYFHMPCPHCKQKGCERCNHKGIHPLASSVYFSGVLITELLTDSIDDLIELFQKAEIPDSANRLLLEINKRLKALKDVGLGYLTLDRVSPTLSRGESQRVRVALSLINKLEDVLHVLDEPTIGQHMTNITKFLPIFKKLPGPVIFIEHDRTAAAYADKAIDIGPGAGMKGGKIIFTGSSTELWEENTPTGLYFSSKEKITPPKLRAKPQLFLKINKAFKHNLKNINIQIPLSRLTVITGVSGSGKSTLVEDVLYNSIKKKKSIGCEKIISPSIKVIMVDQSPIGKNPRSNPATYTKISDIIRKFYASITGLTPSHFSFNTPAGACPTCKGLGAEEIKMRYLPSTWILCPDCEGQRFNEEILETNVNFGDKNYSIADFYKLTISQARKLVEKEKRISQNKLQKLINMLKILEDIGLGYLSLGQSSPSLSGGEAQRIKLAKYLGKNNLQNQIIILDEPSTGLHPQDLNGLLLILDRLVRSGATVIIVEHNLDVIRAADWIIDLGPGAGNKGGDIVYSGSLEGLLKKEDSYTAKALKLDEIIIPRSKKAETKISSKISIKNAHVHNLKNIDVEFPKNALNLVTGVSGSGKSSLVNDIIESEAKRRFFETLTMYERQNTREGSEALVDEISGLGVTTHITSERLMHSRRFNVRNTVGKVTEISNHLANLYAQIGERKCPECGTYMLRKLDWLCPSCKIKLPLAKPKHFHSSFYRSACKECHGVGTMQIPRPEKLVIHPEKPLCKGAMYSPGFFPKGYLCKPYNGGYYMLQALAKKYGFNPFETPWNQMSKDAQNAFLYGDKEPTEIHYENKKGQTYKRVERIWGFFADFIRDWDIGGTYTETKKCKSCKGSKLRPEYLAVKLKNYNIHQLSEMPLTSLLKILDKLKLDDSVSSIVSSSLNIIKTRLQFLIKTGLGYINLNRIADSLSAGEAQRVRLSGILGSGLTSLTILLDEPSRGLHPSEVKSLLEVLLEIRDNGNTIIMVEHDLLFIKAADHIVDLGPGAGIKGGKVVAVGKPEKLKDKNTITAHWLSGKKKFNRYKKDRKPRNWLKIYGAKANNLKGDLIKIPHGMLIGLCGISGSGKSTLLIDTLGRELSPKKQTTSVAYEPIQPGEFEKIEGELSRTIIMDQTRAKINNPLTYLGLKNKFYKIFSESEDAQILGLTEKDLKKRCTACKGNGIIKTDMGFLPDIYDPCDICNGSGYSQEAWQVKMHGISFPELNNLTIDEVYKLFKENKAIESKLNLMKEVGLGYLVLNQPAYTLSGGEAQRLKIVRELSKKNTKKTLYILDEPTIGQHLEDISRLINVLHKLVENGHTVIVIEHHPHLLAACDWLIELGPGAGPYGGKVIAAGPPETIAQQNTPTAPYLKEILEEIS